MFFVFVVFFFWRKKIVLVDSPVFLRCSGMMIVRAWILHVQDSVFFLCCSRTALVQVQYLFQD